MSESASYRWELQAERRRQAYLERIRETTARYHARYESLLQDLENQGLDQYMPFEFSSLRESLNELALLIRDDPEEARDLSHRLCGEISRLPAMAREARREFQARERLRQQELSELRRKAASELADFLQSLPAAISDPIERDFAFEELKALQSQYAGRVSGPDEWESLKAALQRQFDVIRQDAAAKARAWKEKKAAETAAETRETLLGIHTTEAEADASKNPKAAQSFLESLQGLRRQAAEQGATIQDIQTLIARHADQTNTAVAEENCRRMVVRAIMDALEKSGFVVSPPKRQAGDKDEVIILARKPAGAEASFRVAADGTMLYKFDRYEGMKCMSDIGHILPMLQDIYGVSLSEKRVLWQNPDRLSKSAKPLEEGGMEQRHGS